MFVHIIFFKKHKWNKWTMIYHFENHSITCTFTKTKKMNNKALLRQFTKPFRTINSINKNDDIFMTISIPCFFPNRKTCNKKSRVQIFGAHFFSSQSSCLTKSSTINYIYTHTQFPNIFTRTTLVQIRFSEHSRAINSKFWI